MRYLFLLSGFLATTLCYSQKLTLTTSNFTVQNGLVGDNVYCVLQDSKGYLWFGTETGISQYNGNEFRNYHLSDGLADNEIFRIDEDSRGRIWFSAFNGRLSYYNEGRFYNASNDSTLAKVDSRQHYTNFFEDSRGMIWLASIGQVMAISPAGNVRVIDEVEGEPSRINNFMERDGEVWGITTRDKSETLLWSSGSFVETLEKNPVKDGFKSLASYLDGKKTHLTQYDFKVTFNYIESLLNPAELPLPRISKLHFYNEHQIWACTYKGAILIDRKNGITNRFLEELIVTHVMQDREGGYWMTTLGEGVFYMTSLEYKSISEVNGRELGAITSFVPEADGISFGGLRGTFGKLIEDSVALSQTRLGGRLMAKAMVEGFKPNTYLLAMESQLSERDQTEHLREAPLAAKTIATWKGKFIIGNNSFILVVSPKQLDQILDMDFYEARDEGVFEKNSKFKEHIELNSGYTLDIEPFQNGLLVGTAEGLYFMSEEYAYEKVTGHALMRERVNHIAVNKDKFVLATHGFGVLIQNKGQWVQLTSKDGLASDIVRKVVVQNDSVYWAATNGGVSRIELKKGGMTINNLTRSNGLNSEQVFDLIVKENELILGTGEGMSIVKLEDWNSTEVPPLLNIVDVSEDGVSKLGDVLSVNYGTTNLEIRYDGIHIRSLNKMSYQYRLVGLSDDWTATELTSVNFGNLRPGSYTFEVQAISAFGVPSEIQSVEFLVERPFWLTWWFIAIISLLILLAVIGVTSLFLKRKRLKSQQQLEFKLRISEAERKALQSQLNPHFIFNSLNSIQSMVLKKEPRQAYDYLERFSKLIRRILQFSETSYIPLSDELETLQLYMELENERLRNRFDFSVEVAENVSLGQNVPSLMIQPYVENSIWHGLMPLEGKRPGILKVSVYGTDSELFVEVYDNGVGRKTAVREGAMGTKIANELINKFDLDRFGTITIEDLVQAEEPIGTKVTLHIIHSKTRSSYDKSPDYRR